MGKSSTIAKNTVLLYVQMLITMCVGLITSRIVLNTLGVENYGIYNVVGGVVIMFSFLSDSLGTAISRFLTFALGKNGDGPINNLDELNRIFSTSLTIQIVIAFFICFLTELLGVWFLNTSMNIPAERMSAANWVIQCSIMSFVLGVIKIPYFSTIIAHEKMNVFAYISIVEAVLKFFAAYLLFYANIDKLKTYAFLLVIVDLIILIIYYFYCRSKFDECHYHFSLDRPLIKEMSGFAGWNLAGTGTYLMNTQGVNILTNIFFGVSANAARGVAEQVRGVMMKFVYSFTTAINPQITKSYASGDMKYLFNLICRGAKFSFYLMLFFLVPLMFEIDFVLKVWLDDYPPLAPLFLRLLIIDQMIDFLGNTTARTVWATGKVRQYYLATCSVSIMVFPLTWFLFKIGFSAEWSYIVFIAIYILLIPIRLSIIKKLVGFHPLVFYKRVIYPVSLVTLLSFVLPCFFYFYIEDGLAHHIAVILISVISVFLCIVLFGVDKEEKLFLVDICRLKCSSFFSK